MQNENARAGDDTGEHPATASDIGGGDDLGEDAG
jgi:hypothetical protein